ncbi:MAG: hypothetical protein KJ064_06170 [Anaerolineae bacterium]|jgi:hypothetical protein|nr:hypothetical protein [Anaerolineae bacterium]
MTSVRRLPYRTPTPDCIKINEWMQLGNDDDLIPLGTVLPDWDPAVSIRASAYCELDVERIFEECSLNPTARLRVAASWFSPGTMLRGSGSSADFTCSQPYQNLDLSINAEGIKLAKSIEIITQLILLTPGNEARPFSPKMPGSILFQDKYSVTLEGDGARFPIEVVNFEETSYFQSKAGWILYWNPDDLYQTVLGDIRLYINSQHERVKRAVSENLAEDFDIREAIRIDTARIMLYGALNNADFVENPKQYPDGSVGAAIRRMINLYFPGDSLSDLRAKLDQPHIFDHLIQDRLLIFWKQ